MKGLIHLALVVSSVAVGMTGCQSERGESVVTQAVARPGLVEASAPQGEELRRLSDHPNVAIVLAEIESIQARRKGFLSFLRDERQSVRFEIRRVIWVGSRLPSNFSPKLEKGFTGDYWAYNRGGRKFSGFFGTKTFPLDSFGVGRTYWLVISSGLSTGPHIVAWEEVGAEGTGPQPSKDR